MRLRPPASSAGAPPPGAVPGRRRRGCGWRPGRRRWWRLRWSARRPPVSDPPGPGRRRIMTVTIRPPPARHPFDTRGTPWCCRAGQAGQMVVRRRARPCSRHRPGPGEGAACGICGSTSTSPGTAPPCWRWPTRCGALSETGSPRLDLDRDVHGPRAGRRGGGGRSRDRGLRPGTVVTSIPVLMAPRASSLPQGELTRPPPATASTCCCRPPAADRAQRSRPPPQVTGALGRPIRRGNRSGIQPGEAALVLVPGRWAGRRRRSPSAASSPSSPRTCPRPAGARRSPWRPRGGRPGGGGRLRGLGRTGGGRPLVVFEAIGLPGIIDEVLRGIAPPRSRLVVAGVHGAHRPHPAVRHRRRSWTSGSASPTTRPSSPRRCGCWPRARSTPPRW